MDSEHWFASERAALGGRSVMEQDNKKSRYQDVIRRLVIGAFSPAVAAALVSAAGHANAADRLTKPDTDDGGHPAGVFDLEAVGAEAEPMAIYNRIYNQIYFQTIYPQCHYTQYPQCGPACW